MFNSSLFSIIVLSSLCLAQAAQADTIVTCTDPKSPKDVVQVRLDRNNRIIRWDNSRWVNSKSRAFGNLARPFSEGNEPWEGESTFKAANGFSIVRAVTTADVEMLGVNPTTLKGFYGYQDIGSGNGNSKTELVCR